MISDLANVVQSHGSPHSVLNYSRPLVLLQNLPRRLRLSLELHLHAREPEEVAQVHQDAEAAKKQQEDLQEALDVPFIVKVVVADEREPLDIGDGHQHFGRSVYFFYIFGVDEELQAGVCLHDSEQRDRYNRRNHDVLIEIILKIVICHRVLSQIPSACPYHLNIFQIFYYNYLGKLGLSKNICIIP